MADTKDVRGLLKFRKQGTVAFGNTSVDTNETSENKHPNNVNTYLLKDYNWAEEYQDELSVDRQYKVPKAILTEFQPVRVWNWDNTRSNIISSLVGKAANIPGARAGAQAFVQNYAYTPESLIDKYAKEPESVLGLPMKFVKQLLTGQYLGSYEIPFLTDEYLKADTTDSWSIGGSEKAVGEEASKVLQEDYSINFPMVPIWSKDGESNLDFEYDFYLINNSTTNLIKNFKFLHAFTSGNFWVQLDLMQQSPNIYDIVVPGRFHKYFCALGITVSYMGKTREEKTAQNTLQLQGINLGNDMVFPDAYKVNVKSRDLTPNNFNTYMDFLKGNYDKIEIGTEVDQLTGIDILSTGE